MSNAVLSRELSAYQSAYDKYNRDVKRYNNAAENYNASFYHDANNGLAGTMGGQWSGNAPADMAGYGLWTDPGNGSNQLLRKPTAVTNGPAGTLVHQAYGWDEVQTTPERYYVQLDNGQQVDWNQRALTQAGYLAPAGVSATQPTRPGNLLLQTEYVAPDGFTEGGRVQLQTGTFSNTPKAPNPFSMKKPAMTISQAKNLANPSLAQQETGLIGSVLLSKGVK